MPVSFNSGSCNTNPTDYQCYCLANSSSEYYKIFDVATREYLCCGTVGMDYTNNSPNSLGSNDPTNNTILNAALRDDPRCLGWWNGSANHFANLSGTVPPIPPVGSAWYLPDTTTTTNGLYPASYGPSDHDIGILSNQALINQAVTIPLTTISGTGTVLTCDTTDASKPNNKPYWLRYITPNNRQTTYSETLVCADVDYVKGSDAFSKANFALFAPQCLVTDTSKTNECFIPVGEVTNVGRANLGNLVISSKGYGGGIPVTPVEQGTPWYAQAWFWILMVIIVIIIVITISLIVYYQAKKKYSVV